MHTYRKADVGGWYVCFRQGDYETPVGPGFDVEAEAAAYASFLNGGRYNPYEIEAVFAVPQNTEETDDSTHPDRPPTLDDYPVERRKRG